MILLDSVLAHCAQRTALLQLLEAYEIQLCLHANTQPIPASYWGEPEAGIQDGRLHARRDTPLHSVLHEACHLICMDSERRQDLFKDAGGDDLEEAAVCYLQLVLADTLPLISWQMLAGDMDEWGYSFRVGSTRQWFMTDADDARAWLLARQLLPIQESAQAAC